MLKEDLKDKLLNAKQYPSTEIFKEFTQLPFNDQLDIALALAEKISNQFDENFNELMEIHLETDYSSRRETNLILAKFAK